MQVDRLLSCELDFRSPAVPEAESMLCIFWTLLEFYPAVNQSCSRSGMVDMWRVKCVLFALLMTGTPIKV